MKIGIDARFFGTPGKGLGRYTEKLVKSLEVIDTENEYEIFLYGESFDHYQPADPRFTKIKVPYRWYGFGEQFLYPFFLWSRKLDLIHFPHFNVPVLFRRPYVVTIHDLILLHYPTQKASTHNSLWYNFKYFIYLFVIRSAIKRAKAIFTVSQFTHQDVEGFYKEASGKMHLTLEGVDQFCYWTEHEKGKDILLEYWKAVARESEKPYVLYVGNSYPHKNLNIFLELAKAKPDVDIVLVGKKDYFYERLEKHIRESRVENIYLIGNVPDIHLGILYQNAHAYVFPSLYEGFGLPPLEAMQYGVPILVSNRGSLPEIVGDAGLIADPENREAFIQQYQILVSDDQVRRTLQEKGYSRAKGFSWTKMAEATKDIYTKTVSG